MSRLASRFLMATVSPIDQVVGKACQRHPSFPLVPRLRFYPSVCKIQASGRRPRAPRVPVGAAPFGIQAKRDRGSKSPWQQAGQARVGFGPLIDEAGQAHEQQGCQCDRGTGPACMEGLRRRRPGWTQQGATRIAFASPSEQWSLGARNLAK